MQCFIIMYCNVNICKYFYDLKKEQKYKKINYYFLLIINFILFSIFSTFIFIVNEKKKIKITICFYYMIHYVLCLLI